MAEIAYKKKPFRPEKLDRELTDANDAQLGGKYKGFRFDDNTDGDITIITSEDLLAAEQTNLDALVTAHDGSTKDAVLNVRRKILRAENAGRVLLAEFGAENIVSGLTKAQMRALVASYKEVIRLVSTGSLNLAKEDFEAIPADPANGMDQARKDRWIGKMGRALARL